MVLIVLCLPKDDVDWISVCSDNLLLQHCCYWYKVDGDCLVKCEDQREKIYIPRGNVLDQTTLTQLIEAEDARRKGLMR